MSRSARKRLYVALATALALFASGGPALAADYAGGLIDAHSHLPNATAIDAYVAAMKRHNVTKVVLLGVGGAQKDDVAWIAAAARKYPDRVVAGQPLPDPTAAPAAARLDAELTRSGAHVVGEVHVRQVSRKIDRSPADPAFVKILEVAARPAARASTRARKSANVTRSSRKTIASRRP